MDALSEAIVRLLRRQDQLENRVASFERQLRAHSIEPEAVPSAQAVPQWELQPSEPRPEGSGPPSEPRPTTPSEPRPEGSGPPSEPQPSTPSEPRPEGSGPPSEPQPSTPSEPRPSGSGGVPAPSTRPASSGPEGSDGPFDLPTPSPSFQPAEPVLETRLGLTWINRIGAVTVLFAVAFFFKLAVENEWIGESGRVVLGVLAGFASIAAGDWMWKRGHQLYAQGVSALGIGVLYLSFYAAFGFYKLVPAGFAFVMMAASAAMGGVLALRYNAQPILVIGALAAYATPILLSTGEDRPWVFFGYLAVINAGALAAARHRGWIPAEAILLIGTAGLYMAWFADRFRASDPAKQLVATVFAVIFSALFASSNTRIFAAAAQAAGLLILSQIWKHDPTSFFLFTLGLSACGLVIAQVRNWSYQALVTLSAAFLSYAATSFSYETPELRIFLFLTLLFLLFFVWLPFRFLVQRIAVEYADLLVAAVAAIAYFASVFALFDGRHNAYLALLSVALGGLYLALGYQLWQVETDALKDARPALLSAGVALCFVTLAIPIYFSGYTITIAWAVEMAVLAWVATRMNVDRLVWSAALLGLMVAMRVFLVDSTIYLDPKTTLAFGNARFLAALIAAIALGLSAWWAQPKPLRLAFYLAAHSVMLFGLLQEMIELAGRLDGPYSSIRSALISLTVAAYALLLIVAGVAYRMALNRILGLGLLAVVILKLYLLDVWMMQLVYRVIAFGVFGLLLLATSFVYSRYRASIETWWKQDGDHA
ncbi:MAG: DUF2339 domain-containing protein [Bryobacteraceae bacterium]